MPGETDLHKTLKKEACRWLHRMGYRCIAAEVNLRPLGIIDAVGTGRFRPYYNYLSCGNELPQVCFVECKASRADFLRDKGDVDQFALFLKREKTIRTKRRQREMRRTPYCSSNMGKFNACLMNPMANLHYILAPNGMIQKKDLPARWGLLSFGEGGVNVVIRADWQERSRMEYVECSIARTLTGDIYRADARAMNSVNREIFAQQTALADKIRNIRPHVVLAPPVPRAAVAG